MYSAGMSKKSLTVVLTGAALLLVGCGQNTLTAPTSDQGFSGHIIALPVSERPTTSDFLGQDAQSVTVVVSAEKGGVVSMGRYSLDFPAGALTADTPITIRQSDPVAMIVEFEPHGIHFQKPVHVTARVGDLVSSSSKTVGVAWMNDVTGEWEVVGAGAEMESAQADLWHFSRYTSFEE